MIFPALCWRDGYIHLISPVTSRASVSVSIAWRHLVFIILKIGDSLRNFFHQNSALNSAELFQKTHLPKGLTTFRNICRHIFKNRWHSNSESLSIISCHADRLDKKNNFYQWPTNMHKHMQWLTFIHSLYRYNFILLLTLFFVNKIYQSLILKNVSTISFNIIYKQRHIL